MNSPELNVINHKACRHLLSKGMFVTGQLNPADDPVEASSDGYCWCNRNQGMYGPDGGIVDRASCAPARACYEGRL